MPPPNLTPSSHLADVRYEIRGPLARRAVELERAGHEIIKLNIGNPGAFGFRMPESMRAAIVENLQQADPYCHQKGIFQAREAVVMQQHDRGVMDVTADEVFIGNGVSELILFSLRALLNEGDEVLIPSPDYPLWTAAVVINGAKAVHYPCPPERGFLPSVAEMRDAGHIAHPRAGDHHPQQSHRRGLSARAADRDGGIRRGHGPGDLLGRDLRPDPL
jgi:alanine-synthesizing transaminase